MTVNSDWLFTYLTKASTVSEETVGDGAMTTTGSPSNMSSQSICRWMSADWKHLMVRSEVTLVMEEAADLQNKMLQHRSGENWF